ncbi:Uncharacterised protein [Salmonella enterica subsp. enterica serovar Bovismorbificans]|uniref:Uncharacterized protein n=1 Tax=Salmonella enterica subsp. enterica serovar Bovismorbificans TaxID=58097 RepID=A0A655ET19_SALET|nr:Uncharacterised protein [Salmonella enterica subsp. enterica serovar Bovismorbificans]
MHRVHSFHQEQTKVHQVAVTPAAVAFKLIQQVWRQLFIGTGEIVGNPDAPPCPTH